jgi:hypothetical protein
MSPERGGDNGEKSSHRDGKATKEGGSAGRGLKKSIAIEKVNEMIILWPDREF